MGDRPTFAELLPRAQRLAPAMGCCLHIVLDDENLENRHIAFCVNQAVEQGHPECEALANDMLRASWRTRQRLSREYAR